MPRPRRRGRTPLKIAAADVCTTVGEIQRYYGYFMINHDQQLFGDRPLLNINAPVEGRMITR